MSTDEGMKFAFIVAAIEGSPYWDPMTEEAAEAVWDEWIARVRREAKAEAWQEGVNFALPSKETYWISKHNPHRVTGHETGGQA